jgi:hypothetical protein
MLTNSPSLVYSRIIDLFDDGASFVADVGGFSGVMRTANVLFRLNTGSTLTTLAAESVTVAKSFNFTVPRKSLGHSFEAYAYTNDPNPGTIMISIQ